MSKISSYKKPGRRGHRYRKQINGRRYEKVFYGNKLQRDEQYKKWLEKLERDNKDRSYDGSKTWNYFKEQFLTYMRTETNKTTGRLLYRPRTIAEYTYALEHFEKLIKPHYINDLTYKDVADFRRQSKENADEAHTDYYGANKDNGCLIRALEWGMREGLVPVINLDTLKKQFTTSKVVVSVLQPWQLDMIFKYSTPNMRVAAKMGYYAGLRPEEAYSLLLEKIDFSTGIVWLSPNEDDSNRGTSFWIVKRDKNRPVFFPQDLLEDIKSLKSPGPYVLMTDEKNPRPYNVDNFSKAWKSNLKHVNDMIIRYEADTPKISCTYKIFRKTHTTMMLKVGAKEEDASLYVGHADTQVTEEHYLEAETLKSKLSAQQIAHLEKVKKYLKKLPKIVEK
ncbi:MAG: site-specific integrase [Elusimicrobiaceae bacterium]|nr:site-specific integrase [Elusimicrobiaceae bacterium]